MYEGFVTVTMSSWDIDMSVDMVVANSQHHGSHKSAKDFPNQRLLNPIGSRKACTRAFTNLANSLSADLNSLVS